MALNKLEIPTTDPETNSRSPKLGTRWVAPGEGSTWRELWAALGRPSRAYASEVTHRRIQLGFETAQDVRNWKADLNRIVPETRRN